MNNVVYILIALMVLLALAVVFVLKSRRAVRPISKLGAVSLALVIAGIVFGENRFWGYGFIGAGVVLALIDIFSKNRVKGAGDSKLIEEKKRQAQENRQKILDFLKDKEKIANNDVEKLLGVSNATAERYLDQLEKDGLLKQVGKIGRDVYYKKL